jgi:hypothetical protein
MGGLGHFQMPDTNGSNVSILVHADRMQSGWHVQADAFEGQIKAHNTLRRTQGVSMFYVLGPT